MPRMLAGHAVSGRALSGVLGVVVVAALGVAAVPATAATAPVLTSVDLATSNTAVVTSTHAHIRATMYADASNLSGKSPTYDVSVDLSASGFVESHTWDFPVPASALTYGSAGRGTVVLPAANVAPFGKIQLRFSPTGAAKKTTCGSATAYTLVRPVSVKGTFFFDSASGPAAWGTLGSTSKTFTFAKGSTLTTSYGGRGSCGLNDQTPCTSQVGFDAAGAAVYVDGSSGGDGEGYLEALRVTKLTAPIGATRSDAADGAAKQVLTKTSGGGASLTITGTTRAAGSAVISQTAKGLSSKGDCGKKGTKPITTTFWQSATFLNGKPPLSLTEQIYGPIVLRKPQGALISMDTPRP